jgi:hypothetical protein
VPFAGSGAGDFVRLIVGHARRNRTENFGCARVYVLDCMQLAMKSDLALESICARENPGIRR